MFTVYESEEVVIERSVITNNTNDGQLIGKRLMKMVNHAT